MLCETRPEQGQPDKDLLHVVGAISGTSTGTAPLPSRTFLRVTGGHATQDLVQQSQTALRQLVSSVRPGTASWAGHMLRPPDPAARRRGWTHLESWPEKGRDLSIAGTTEASGPAETEARLKALEKLADQTGVSLSKQLAPAEDLLLALEVARGSLSRVHPTGAPDRTTWRLDMASNGSRRAWVLRRARTGETVAAVGVRSNDLATWTPSGLRRKLLAGLKGLVLGVLLPKASGLKYPPSMGSLSAQLLVEKPSRPDIELREKLDIECDAADHLLEALGGSLRTVNLRRYTAPGTPLRPLFRQLELKRVCAPRPPRWHREPGGATVTICQTEIDRPLRLRPFTAGQLLRAASAVFEDRLTHPVATRNAVPSGLTTLVAALKPDPDQFGRCFDECGVEVLGCYVPFHSEEVHWGVYLQMDMLLSAASRLASHRTGAQSSPNSSLSEFAALVSLVLFHEWHHHVEEVAVSLLEVARGKKLLMPWHRAHYKPPHSAINERLANADGFAALEQLLLGHRGSLPGSLVPPLLPRPSGDLPGLRGAVKRTLGVWESEAEPLLNRVEEWLNRSPGDYGQWGSARRDSFDPHATSDYDRTAGAWLSEVVSGKRRKKARGAHDRVGLLHAGRALYAGNFNQSVPVRLFTAGDQSAMETALLTLEEEFRRSGGQGQ